MAGNVAPNTVTNGLVLYLDAGNTNSYPGTGTSWRDISGNSNNGTLTNGPTFNSGNLGSIVFDGTNDYVSSFTSSISPVGTTRTILCFIYLSTTSRAGICGTRSSSGGGFGFTTNRTSAGNLTYFHTGGSLIETAASLTNNVWAQVGVVYNATAATATLYKNGNQIGSTSTGFSAEGATSYNGIIGDENETPSSVFFNGRIANMQIYNRALSATEILQNYNALKGRYGL
jgi:hypothetical protein